MDKEKNESGWELAGQVIAGTVLATGYIAAKSSMWLGKKIVSGSKVVYEKTVDGKRKIDEIKQIEINVKKFQEEEKEIIQKKQAEYEKKINVEIVKYDLTCKSILNVVKTSEKYSLYYEGMNENSFRTENKNTTNKLYAQTSLNSIEVASASLAKGVGTGVLTGGVAAGVMTAFGTASTGTALSALSGSAFTNALLASFGGGSLAAGGFGIVGGTIVLGSIVTIPALAVAGVIADKEIEKAYIKAKEAEEQVNLQKKACDSLFKHYELVILFMQQLNSNAQQYLEIFTKVIDASTLVASFGVEKTLFNKLFDEVIEIAKLYLGISVLNTEGKFNERIEEEIHSIHELALGCGTQYEEFYDKLTEENRLIMNELPHATVENYSLIVSELKRLQKKVEQQHQEIANLKEVNKQLEDLLEQQKAEFPVRYDACLKEVQLRYPEVQNEKVLEFIASGELSYQMWGEVDKVDYSQIVMAYAKALETLLIDVLKVFGLFQRGDERDALNNLIKKYISDNRYEVYWKPNAQELQNNFNSIRKIRNPAAHKGKTQKEDMLKVRTIVMGGGKSGLEKEGVLFYLSKKLDK
ncbi:hypothetical protein [Veillonella sp. R32]|uniref:hypothetical protein n=1 Tax=Veillonella sp. R32 TaxID=2021312 RepID=UPI0013895EBB|nr:hypothetical protein [Veillonella sp. R32]KAF1683264.1 hypothetical protein VER_02565 [Veillonella sp. R32]